MILKDFDLEEKKYFIAMVYYALIMNRTFLILLTDDSLVGIQGNGAISAQGGKDVFTRAASRHFAVRGDLSNPFSYIKGKYFEPIENEDLAGDSIITNHKPNFRIYYKDISSVTYDPKKKGGMGVYPHDGKVYITANNKKREFIILGEQSGADIKDWILTK